MRKNFKMEKEKLFAFSLDHCPFCGMDGTVKMVQALWKPTIIACFFCSKWIYRIEIKETYFDPSNIKESFMKMNDKFQTELAHDKEIQEIKEIKE